MNATEVQILALLAKAHPNRPVLKRVHINDAAHALGFKNPREYKDLLEGTKIQKGYYEVPQAMYELPEVQTAKAELGFVKIEHVRTRPSVKKS